MRDMCEPCPISTITQGSIFNNALNEDFDGLNNLGLLISARCDMANNKSPKYSYLPVISLEKYVSFYTIKKLLREQKNEEIRKIESLLGNPALGKDIVKMYGLEQCVEKLITDNKNKSKADTSLEKIKFLSEAESKSWNQLSHTEKCIIPQKKIRQELKNIAENKIEGFYLIDNIVDYNDGAKAMGPHVVLLREIHHISAKVTDLIKNGYNHDENHTEVARYLMLEPNGMTYVLANLKSPYLELLMQKFSSLFTRIGVKDPSEETIEKFLKKYLAEA